jgi:hypothetical protein
MNYLIVIVIASTLVLVLVILIVIVERVRIGNIKFEISASTTICSIAESETVVRIYICRFAM